MLRVSVLRLVMFALFACAATGFLARPYQTLAQGIWNGAPLPAVIDSGDDKPVEIGVRFSSDRDGYITGIRFYKSPGNLGPHTGSIWSATGARLATGTFSGETSSGWQQLQFPTPLAIKANTTYIASYFTPSGHYSYTNNYFRSGVDNPPLHAPISYDGAPNGLYSYSATSVFPQHGYQARNFWIDVLFATAQSSKPGPPAVSSTSPPSGGANVYHRMPVTAAFSEEMDAASVTSETFILQDQAALRVPATVNYNNATRTATLVPAGPLVTHAGYTAIIKGGPAGIRDVYGHPLDNDYSWNFTTALTPDEGPGGPVLVVKASENPFSGYYAEILRAEGLNSFAVSDITAVSPELLKKYDVVVLGEMTLSADQAAVLTDWVKAGGKLIAMRPDRRLAPLLGLASATGTLDNRYLRIDNATGPGIGITGETIQFHGEADLYTLNGATAVATLYSDAATPTKHPAVSFATVGAGGGQAVAFTYDLARSVVYTRQGNPQWAGQNRDPGDPWFSRVISQDMFFGPADFDRKPDWIDFAKIAIPQADEQQRLLANLILQMNGVKPIPRFWYLPRGLRAAIIMTGDDHFGTGGTPGRFDRYLEVSKAGCSVEDWECVRGSSYVLRHTMSDAAAARYHSLGFEIARHIDTGCADWKPTILEQYYSGQIRLFRNSYPSLPSPASNRTHCVTWSDWASQPKVELAHGIRLDTTYYYYPSTWVRERPGMFTGSGMPMRFADSDGTMIDVYQAATQLTDESSSAYGLFNPAMVDTLLDNALGPLGYYGVFTANMHTDLVESPGSEAVITSAQARNVPIVSSRQMLTWLDGRNGSYFDNLAWNGGILSFSIVAGNGARGLVAMLPAVSPSGSVTSLTLGGSPVAYNQETIKGIRYVTFPAVAGTYQVRYGAASGP